VIDPGNQSYHELEKTGFNLWARCQDCQRWTLLTKNNLGHSTLTVNDALHRVDGMASLVEFKDGDIPEAAFEMSPVFEGQLKSARRRFIKDSPRSLVIEDEIEISESTSTVTWQLMTQAEVEFTKTGAVLRQEGKQLKLEILSHLDYTLSIISLDPAPLKLDRQIRNLKRIELRIPAWTFERGNGMIKVRLSGK
jgi:hypothetical protein